MFNDVVQRFYIIGSDAPFNIELKEEFFRCKELPVFFRGASDSTCRGV